MNIGKCLRRECGRHAYLRCMTLLLWFAMSVALLAVFTYQGPDIVRWVEENPALNQILLLFFLIAYIGLGLWLLQLNFTDETTGGRRPRDIQTH